MDIDGWTPHVLRVATDTEIGPRRVTLVVESSDDGSELKVVFPTPHQGICVPPSVATELAILLAASVKPLARDAGDRQVLSDNFLGRRPGSASWPPPFLAYSLENCLAWMGMRPLPAQDASVSFPDVARGANRTSGLNGLRCSLQCCRMVAAPPRPGPSGGGATIALYALHRGHSYAVTRMRPDTAVRLGAAVSGHVLAHHPAFAAELTRRLGDLLDRNCSLRASRRLRSHEPPRVPLPRIRSANVPEAVDVEDILPPTRR